MSDHPYNSLSDAKAFCYVILRPTRIKHLSDYWNIPFIQFCVHIQRSLFTLWQFHAATFYCVASVVFKIPQVQMFWINTPRIITAVKNAYTRRDDAIMYFPRESVSLDTDITPIHSVAHDTMTERKSSADPNPTGFCFLNVTPKFFLYWFARFSEVALLARLKEVGIHGYTLA